MGIGLVKPSHSNCNTVHINYLKYSTCTTSAVRKILQELIECNTRENTRVLHFKPFYPNNASKYIIEAVKYLSS